MPPSKRLKRSPSAEESQSTEPAAPTQSSSVRVAEDGAQSSKTNEQIGSVDVKDGQRKSLGERKSWYGGSWPRTPRKAAPITQLATETISAGGEVLARTGEKAKSIAGSLKGSSRPPSIYMSPGVSTRSLPATASASRVSVSMPKSGLTSSSQDDMDIDGPVSSMPQDEKLDPKPPADESLNIVRAEASTPSLNRVETPVSGWRGWIPNYRYGTDPPVQPQTTLNKEQSDVTSAGLSTNPGTSSEPNDGPSDASQTEPPSQLPPESSAASTLNLPSRPRSWFGLWSGENQTKDSDKSLKEDPEPSQAENSAALSSNGVQDDQTGNKDQPAVAQPVSDATISLQTQPVSGQTSTAGWSFWPRNGPPATTKDLDKVNEEKQPNLDASKPGPSNQIEDGSRDANTPSRKRERPASVEIPAGTREDRISKKSPDGKTSATAAIDVLPSSKDDKAAPRRQQSANLLLPSLKQTLKAAENPGLLSRLAGYFYSSKAPPAKHVNLVTNPPKIQRALAIGVHGYFPAPFLRTVIGQPRGTSIRFATNAADAIVEWSRKHGCSPEVEKIALEGEGKIEERVELLWQLLLMHLQKVREADFVLVACHSQGVPVAVQLIAKLIALGCFADKTKVGLCAMAGVNQGPFAEYKSRWIGGSAGELFDFASPNSKVSMDYEIALNTVLEAGVKIVLVGSIDDQLVSMESATFGNAEHPCLFRAVFINSQVHAPTFLVHLVGFALKLRNLGIPDHGLIRELSNSLSGSFTGDGHSRLYEDFQLYDTAIEFALETTPYTDVPLVVKKTPSASSQNPYILPFAMRGVLEEDFVRSELHSEMVELLKQFDDWKPTTKPLKDVKFRLEGVRSKI